MPSSPYTPPDSEDASPTCNQVRPEVGAVAWTILGVFSICAVVFAFGDIGFDRPGRFGLDFFHAIVLLGVSAIGLPRGAWLGLLAAIWSVRMRRACRDVHRDPVCNDRRITMPSTGAASALFFDGYLYSRRPVTAVVPPLSHVDATLTRR